MYMTGGIIYRGLNLLQREAAMNYNECLEYIDKITKKYGISPGLHNMNCMLDYYKRPEKPYKIIHVAGTNGKGSISAYMASILTEAGYTVGRYTSPCISDYREKIIIENKSESRYISEDEVAKYITSLKEDIHKIFSDGHPTPFEMETVMALRMFKDCSVDYAIVECGMGGELDATNAICHKEMCVFAPISLDHTSFLGSAIEKIAQNKAGIINKDELVVSAEQENSVKSILEQYTNVKYPEKIDEINLSASISTFLYRGNYYSTHMLGAYQPYNASVAIEAMYLLLQNEINDMEKLKNIILRGISNAKWPGRFEVISDKPLVIFDGAHNPAALKALINSIEEIFPKAQYYRTGIVGVFADKDINMMAGMLKGHFDELHTVTAKKPRGMDAIKLGRIINMGTEQRVYAHEGMTPYEVVESIECKSEKKKRAFFIFGSLSLYMKAK